jgi:ParB family chromosome partitioning protein
MVKHRALGKGLGALIPAAQEPPRQEQEKDINKEIVRPVTIPVKKLVPNPDQPRKDIDPDGLQALADSLKVHGVVQPLVVRDKNGTYEIVAGERRWRAAQMAGISEVPVIYFDGSDQEAKEVSLIENIQREDLSPLEVASAIQDLINRFSLTQEEVSRKLGWSRSAITNKIRLLKLPEDVRLLLKNGFLSEGHGRALLALGSEEDISLYAKKAVHKMWSVRQLEKMIQERKVEILSTVSLPETGHSPTPLQDQAKLLSRKFGCKLRLSGPDTNMKLSVGGLKTEQIEKFLEFIEREGETLFPGK